MRSKSPPTNAPASFSPSWLSLTTKITPLSPRCFSLSKKSRQLVVLSLSASSTASILRRPSIFTPIAICTAWLCTTPSTRTFSTRASRIKYGYSSSNLRRANLSSSPSSFFASRDTVDAENPSPQSSSATFFTLRVDTPWMYISTIAKTSAFSLRW